MDAEVSLTRRKWRYLPGLNCRLMRSRASAESFCGAAASKLSRPSCVNFRRKRICFPYRRHHMQIIRWNANPTRRGHETGRSIISNWVREASRQLGDKVRKPRIKPAANPFLSCMVRGKVCCASNSSSAHRTKPYKKFGFTPFWRTNLSPGSALKPSVPDATSPTSCSLKCSTGNRLPCRPGRRFRAA